MPLSFADATGNLFNRLGRCGKVISQLRSYQLSQLTNMTSQSVGIVGQLNAEPDVQAITGSAYIGLLDGGAASIGSTMQSQAAAILNRMIFRDNAQINQTLTSSNTLLSLTELIRQMKVAGATIQAISISFTMLQFADVGNSNNVGNGIINVSVTRPLDGKVLENAYAETIKFTCASDSYLNNATEGNEGFAVTGQGNQSNVFAFNWPLGSNCSASLNAIDGNADNASGNLLTNSGWADGTANVPDNWTVVTGTAGTNFALNASAVYDTGNSLEIIGDGTTNFSIKQEFDSTDGTTGVLEALTQYSLCLFMKRDGVAAASGQLTIDLIDSGNTVLLDENDVPNSVTIDLTALTVTWAAFTADFRTPHVMPDDAFIRIRLTADLTTGRSVYLDKMSLGEFTQLYTSGPFVAVHAGSVPFVTGDYGYAYITSGNTSTLDNWQPLFARLFPDMLANELMLPSSNTPTISASMITN